MFGCLAVYITASSSLECWGKQNAYGRCVWACVHAHVFMCACAFVCIHGGRGAAVSSLMLEDLEEGSRALKLMWRVGLSQAELFQRGLPGGSRDADFMSFVLKSYCLLNLFQPAAAMLDTVPPPYPLLLHSALTHQPSVNTHISNCFNTMEYAYIQVNVILEPLIYYYSFHFLL